ncbi:MAG: hypothetical protein B6U87_03135 [Candidatus Aenigmarchaeota archaeon ex4484_52]|nr:MAG: hypothetical protein B6U87_03135 [Candidatus Aenigmarchaeota archaeon ex4484_52]
MLNKLNSFLDKYYISPIVNDTGYNIVNTFSWAIIFIFAIILLKKYFEKQNQIIDKKFLFALIPYICFGAVLRVLNELNVYSTILLITPLIYFLVFFICFGLLIISNILEQKTKIDYWKIWFSFGLFLLGLAFIKIFLFFKNYKILFVWLGILCFFLILILLLKYVLKSKFFSNINIATLMSHLTDATSSFLAISFFGFTEKHVLSRGLINYAESLNLVFYNSGAWIMFPLKLIVVGMCLHIIDNENLTKKDRFYLKIIIIILGLAPGIRGLFQLIVFT